MCVLMPSLVLASLCAAGDMFAILSVLDAEPNFGEGLKNYDIGLKFETPMNIFRPKGTKRYHLN